MAEGERRLVFDTRGRRKHVVRVVYAILALLMGASLFLVVGPFNLANILGTSGSTTSASKVFTEQSERIERKLRQEPTNEALLLALTRARIGAGNALAEVSPTTGETVATPEGLEELKRATVAWTRYLKQANPANPAVALLVANTYFSLAQTAAGLEEALTNIEKAAAAQQIAADARPNAGVFTTLAIYDYFAGDYAAGDKAAKKAEGMAPSKGEAKEVSKQLVEYRKRGKEFEKQQQEVAKVEQKTGKESLQNPFGGLSGGTATLGE